VLFCIVVCLLVFVDMLAAAIAIGVLSTRLNEEEYVIEDDSVQQPHGPLIRQGSGIAPIIVTRFNTFWHQTVTVQQLENGYAETQRLTLHKLPAKHVKIYTATTTWSGRDSDVFIDGLYLLEGSNITFELLVGSTDYNRGFVNLTLYNSFEAKSENTHFDQRTFPVRAGETKLYSTTFISSRNAYYYIYSIGSDAKVYYFAVTSRISFLNYSDWTNEKHTVYSNGNSHLAVFDDSSYSSMAAAEDYLIVAEINRLYSFSSGTYGQLKVHKNKRSLVYVLPVIPMAGVFAALVTFVICACAGYYIVGRRTNVRIKGGSELRDPLVSQ
jgi:hypothetical protein